MQISIRQAINTKQILCSTLIYRFFSKGKSKVS